MAAFRFEDFTVDPDSFKLVKEGRDIPIEPLVFDLLVLLLDRAGRIVSRDTIVEHVWQGRFISDSTISTAVKSVRKAIGDSGEQQRLIRTVRGRGFEFVGAVTRLDDDAPATPLNPPVGEAGPLPHQDISFVTSGDGTQLAVAHIGAGPGDPACGALAQQYLARC